VICAPSGGDRYGRVLAKCEASQADFGADIVRAGWGLGDGDYGSEQAQASAAHRGIWVGSFIAPAEWRRTHGQEPRWWDWLRSWFE
jgi:endonuclease YncB( thermonuclease family)